MADRKLNFEAEWLGWIEEQYGVVLGDGQMFVSRGRYVMAGSECVAEIGSTDHPEDARNWTAQLGHMPRGGKGIETAKRTVRCNCEAECCQHYSTEDPTAWAGCPNTAEGNWKMDYVGEICDACAARIVAAGGGQYVQPVR